MEIRGVLIGAEFDVKSRSEISVSIVVLGGLVGAGISQQQRSLQPSNPWLNRAAALTNDLGYDALRLERYDRAVMWARLGGAWWKIDQERAHGYFQKAVEILELDRSEKRSQYSATT